MDFSASRDLRRGLVEVREVCGQGRGYFARPAASVAAGGATSVAAGARSSALPEGTVVMENTRPVVAAVNDQYEGRNCRYKAVCHSHPSDQSAHQTGRSWTC